MTDLICSVSFSYKSKKEFDPFFGAVIETGGEINTKTITGEGTRVMKTPAGKEYVYEKNTCPIPDGDQTNLAAVNVCNIMGIPVCLYQNVEDSSCQIKYKNNTFTGIMEENGKCVRKGKVSSGDDFNLESISINQNLLTNQCFTTNNDGIISQINAQKRKVRVVKVTSLMEKIVICV